MSEIKDFVKEFLPDRDPSKVFIEVNSDDLLLKADTFRLKVISEAIGDYVQKHGLEHDITLNDFRLELETAYQSFHNLHENDWGYIEEDRERVHGAF